VVEIHSLADIIPDWGQRLFFRTAIGYKAKVEEYMPRILMIDDSQDLLFLARRWLTQADSTLRITTATSAQDALRMLQEQEFDLIVADYQMPHMTGLELLETLRKADNAIPFIIFTGWGREEVAMRALNLGADYYLMKSGSPQSQYGELAHIIKQLVDHQQTKLALRKAQGRAQKYLDIAGVMLVAIAADETVIMINRKGCTVLGYPEDEIVGKNWFTTFLPAKVREQVWEWFAQMMAGKSKVEESFEAPVQTRSGEERLIAWHNVVLREDQTIVGSLSSGKDITDRKQMEEQLKASEKKYRELIEDINDVVYEITANGKVTYLSPAVESCLGYSPNELIGQSFEVVIASEDRQRALAEFQKVLAGDLGPREYWAITKSGAERWIRTSSKPVFAQGTLVGVRGVFADFTVSKKSEETLRQSEETFRQIFEAIPNPTALWERQDDGTITLDRVNQAGIEATDGRALELLGESLEVIHAAHPQGIALIQQTMATGEPNLRIKVQQPGPEGQEYFLIDCIKTAESTVLAISSDITESQRAENALRESEQKYRALVEHMQEGLAVTDATGHFTFLNRRACAMFGYTEQELQGQHWTILVPERERERIREAERKRRVEGTHSSLEVSFLTKEGQELPLIFRASSLASVDGTYQGTLGMLIDISERKQAEDLLQRQKTELSEFAQNMTHDLRNLLLGIQGYTSLLLEEPDPTYAEKIIQATGHMNSLLHRSLALAEAGLIIEKTAEVDLTRLVRDVAKLTIPQKIHFTQDALPTVQGDAEKLSQIFQNLFENAMVHGEPRQITVSTRMVDGGQELLVKNDGKPILPEHRPHLFTRAFTTKEGAGGLGLAIVRKLVEAHGWQITLEAGPEAETTFCIRIPALYSLPSTGT
jgi:PAS domain S-box-containing protein